MKSLQRPALRRKSPLSDGGARCGREPSPAPEPYYVATQAAEVIDTGCRLLSFVRQLCEDWASLAGEDVAVWEHGHPGCGPRLVALLRAGPDGSTSVRWIC
jgi:hypothetical protein